MQHEIHVTRWERDAMVFISRYAMQVGELLRIHVMGGTGTLYEAVNGAAGLPNVQLASYPYGTENAFLQYFGADKTHLFASLRSQVLSSAIPIDALCCGGHYGVVMGMVGLEALATKESQKLLEGKTLLPNEWAYKYSAAKITLGRWVQGQSYRVELDGERLDGSYLSVLVANTPSYGKNKNPAVDAHPNDGLLDIYLTKVMSRTMFLSGVNQYLSGHYQRLGSVISHYRGTKISVSCADTMCICLDGTVFDENSVEFEIVPYAVDFVCPSGININRLPRIYGKTEG
jgi:diacylglycerol kinase family enzyme